MVRCGLRNVGGHTTEKCPKVKANTPNLALQPGMCAFLAASASLSHESNSTRHEVDEFDWHDGTEELNDFCGSFGALNIRASGQSDSEPPAATALRRKTQVNMDRNMSAVSTLKHSVLTRLPHGQ